MKELKLSQISKEKMKVLYAGDDGDPNTYNCTCSCGSCDAIGQTGNSAKGSVAALSDINP